MTAAILVPAFGPYPRGRPAADAELTVEQADAPILNRRCGAVARMPTTRC